MKGYTRIERPAGNECAVAALHALQRVKTSDVAYFQNSMTCSDKGIFEKKVVVNR